MEIKINVTEDMKRRLEKLVIKDTDTADKHALEGILWDIARQVGVCDDEGNHITEDMGNNETRSFGVFNQGDQGWLAMSRTQSRWFKTEAGAKKWFTRNFPELAVQVGL